MCEGEFNLDERVLCQDGNCIGLVGSDGKCKVCGLIYEGDTPLPEASGPAVPLSEMMDADDTSDDSNSQNNLDNSDDAGAVYSDERICCSDDNCIGIVGPDGRCGTCGRALETDTGQS